MMKIFWLTLGIVFVSFFCMAIGVILTGRKLKGSCGGLGAFKGLVCFFCGKKKECSSSFDQTAKSTTEM